MAEHGTESARHEDISASGGATAHPTSTVSTSFSPYPPASSTRQKDIMAATFAALASEAYCVLDSYLHCYALSENWKNVSGLPPEEGMGDNFKSRIAPDHIRRIVQYLAQTDHSTPVRFQMKHSGGQWRWYELQAGKAEEHRFHCLLKDVTQWANLQSELETSRLDAELATKSRSEFLANMSHELRTPLNAILGFAQMIEAGTYGDIGHPKYHDYIGSIQESGRTLLSKVNDLLEIANIDAGKMTINESVVDVGQMIRQAIEFHSHRAFCEQVTLRNHLPEAPVLVRADRIRLLQVLTNLIANAIQHSFEGGMVDVYCSVRSNGSIDIAIRDTGEGIAPTHLQNIRSAFQQDNSFFARTRNCVGLGLALSKEIVKLHQGSIEVESAPDEGTLVIVHLPRERSISPKREKPHVQARQLEDALD